MTSQRHMTSHYDVTMSLIPNILLLLKVDRVHSRGYLNTSPGYRHRDKPLGLILNDSSLLKTLEPQQKGSTVRGLTDRQMDAVKLTVYLLRDATQLINIDLIQFHSKSIL